MRSQPVESGADAGEATETENGDGTPCCCHRCSRGASKGPKGDDDFVISDLPLAHSCLDTQI